MSVFMLSCGPTKDTEEIREIHEFEIKLKNSKKVIEQYNLPQNVEVYLHVINNHAWLVYRPSNCETCIPTIIKNKVESYKIK